MDTKSMHEFVFNQVMKAADSDEANREADIREMEKLMFVYPNQATKYMVQNCLPHLTREFAEKGVFLISQVK